jgi:alkylation response protein AidB-like acyl-CoA dehydrogenase
MDFRVTEEQQALLQEVDRACKEIRPYENECYLSHHLNDRIVPVFARAHLLGLPVREEYGGGGADLLTYALALERIGQEGTSVRTFFSGHVSLGMLTLQEWGTEEQKQRFLPAACRGEKVFAFGLTEPAAGSDPASMRSTFEEAGDTFRLNGSKHWISNGSIADVAIVFARERAGGEISAFLVERGSPGFTADTQKHKMGLFSSDTGILHFDDCRVPRENLLGPKGKGLSVAFSALMSGRLSVAAGNVGVMQDCLHEAVEYAKTRVQHGKPIARHQLVQRHIGIITANLEAARLLTYSAAMKKMEYEADRTNLHRREEADNQIARAKYFVSNVAFDAAHRTVQVFGAAGYSFECRAARHECDTRVTQIYEGTNEILEQKIAVGVLGKEYAAFR